MKQQNDLKVYASAFAIGLIAGMRSMLAPSIVSSIGAFKHPAAKHATMILAGMELIADKLPFTPNRTSSGPLAGRLVMGAICGAALCSSQKKSKVTGALVGAAGALGSTFAAYEIRKRLHEQRYVPDVAVALLEDGIAVNAAHLLTRSFS